METTINSGIMTKSDEEKINFLRDNKFIEENNISTDDILEILNSLKDETKEKLKCNFLYRLGISDIYMVRYLTNIKNDDIKLSLLLRYNLGYKETEKTANTLSDENKVTLLMNKQWEEHTIIVVIINMKEIKSIINFINKHKDYLEKNNISIYRIIRELPTNWKMEFIDKFENGEIKLTEYEKNFTFASLSETEKNEIKKNPKFKYLYDKYQQAFNMKTGKYGEIIVDLTGNLEQYRNWDEMIMINPLEISEEERKGFVKLCNICPRMRVYDSDLSLLLNDYYASVEEYLEAEKWIQGVIDEVNPEWSDAQKDAYIDYKIGNKVSYSPDVHTEVEDRIDSKQAWKVINKEYGVCWGIAKIESYMFRRIGQEAKCVESKDHAFVKLSNIKVKTSKGMISGNTIIDGTWNLNDNRFGAKPKCFYKSYEKMREMDVDINGKDTQSHLNDEKLKDANIELDTESLREVYSSIGLTDENKKFPIFKLSKGIERINAEEGTTEEKGKKALQFFYSLYPNISKCQSEAEFILKDIMEKLNFKRCVVDRVYEKEDLQKKAVLYVYLQFLDGKENFYYIKDGTNGFIENTLEEFEQKFLPYITDFLDNNGIPKWKTEEMVSKRNEEKNRKIKEGAEH